MLSQRNDYRKDIDALRGISILLVIMNHLQFSFASACFIGVDIFFVISGFLITSHILRDINNGSFSLKHFYLQRMRRILPALVAVLFFTSIAAYILLIHPDLESYAESALASLLSLSNIFFWRIMPVGYFTTDATILPLLHTWSLGVEEQFYLFWPLLIMMIVRPFSYKKLQLVTLVILLTSLFLYGHFSDHNFVYYAPFTRAFELLFGAMLAINYAKIQLSNYKGFNHALSFIGLTLILYGAFVLKAKDYPGYNAIFPSLGAVLLIMAGKEKDALANRLLANELLVSIGLISYSLYLWHWPIIAYFNYTDIPLTIGYKVMIIIAALLLAYFTWKFIEQPFRYRFKFSFAKTLILLLLIPIIITSTLVLMLKHNYNLGYNKVNYDKYLLANDYYGALKKEYGCLDNPAGSTVLPARDLCVIGDLQAKTSSVLLLGDSHAMADAGMLDVFLKDAHLKAYVVGQSGTPFILGDLKEWQVAAGHPIEHNQMVAEEVKRNHYAYVVMGGWWSDYSLLQFANASDTKLNPNYEAFRSSLKQAIAFIIENHSTPVIIFDNPPLLAISRYCGLSKLSIGKQCANAFSEVKNIQAESRQIILELKQQYPQIILIDPNEIICDQTKCYSSLDGVPLYMTSGINTHLNAAGSSLVGEKYLKKYGNPFSALYQFKAESY